MFPSSMVQARVLVVGHSHLVHKSWKKKSIYSENKNITKCKHFLLASWKQYLFQ